MAVSIAYGIGFATVLTLIVLPIFLSFSNFIKQNAKWLYTNKEVTKEEVERAIKEQNEGLNFYSIQETNTIEDKAQHSISE